MIDTAQHLSGAMAENLLTLLCFDEQRCRIARAAIKPQLFESAIFREIAGHAIGFIDQYGKPIGEHLPDHLEHILNGDDARKSRSYKLLVTALFENKDSINGEFVLNQLHKFVRQQNLKSGVIEAVELLEAGKIDEAEAVIDRARKSQAVAFDPGLNLSDPNATIGLLDDLEEEGFDLGIKPFDDNGVIPRRKELFLFIAPRGRGKSWFCTHVAKMGLLQRWSVLIVTLEMSEKRYAARLLQSFFSISKRAGEAKIAEFVLDKAGQLLDIVHRTIERVSFKDAGFKENIGKRVRREFAKRKPLIIKQFPTGSLTPEMLDAYLENLAQHEGVTPDCIIVDYPDLMKHDAKNKRVELGMLLEHIRGIGVKRNCAMVAVSQGNRESERAVTVTGDMAAEDISKLATADVCVTFSQTRAEKLLGLARLLAEKSRNDKDKFSVLVTQAYEIGQFALDALLLNEDYWDLDLAGDGQSKKKRGHDDDAD